MKLRALARVAIALLFAKNVFVGTASAAQGCSWGMTPPNAYFDVHPGQQAATEIIVTRSCPDFELRMYTRIYYLPPEIQSWVSINNGQTNTVPPGIRLYRVL